MWNLPLNIIDNLIIFISITTLINRRRYFHFFPDNFQIQIHKLKKKGIFFRNIFSSFHFFNTINLEKNQEMLRSHSSAATPN